MFLVEADKNLYTMTCLIAVIGVNHHIQNLNFMVKPGNIVYVKLVINLTTVKRENFDFNLWS